MIALKKDPHGKKIFSKHHSRVTLEPKVKAKRREIETLQKKIKELENILSRYQVRIRTMTCHYRLNVVSSVFTERWRNIFRSYDNRLFRLWQYQ